MSVIKEIVCAQSAILPIVVKGPVQRVRPTLGHHIHNSPAPAILRPIVRRLELHFLGEVCTRNNCWSAHAKKVGLLGVRPVDQNSRGGLDRADSIEIDPAPISDPARAGRASTAGT